MNERRNRWQKVCKCAQPQRSSIMFPNINSKCLTCGNLIVVIERRKEMQNVDSFRTGPRPTVFRSKYDYDTLIRALIKYKPTTECVILTEKEINPNQIYMLRKHCKLGGRGFLKVAKKTGLKGKEYYLWLIGEGKTDGV